MEHYLIDTNVVSDYLSASFSLAGMKFMDKAIDAIIAATALAYGYTLVISNNKIQPHFPSIIL